MLYRILRRTEDGSTDELARGMTLTQARKKVRALGAERISVDRASCPSHTSWNASSLHPRISSSWTRGWTTPVRDPLIIAMELARSLWKNSERDEPTRLESNLFDELTQSLGGDMRAAHAVTKAALNAIAYEEDNTVYLHARSE